MMEEHDFLSEGMGPLSGPGPEDMANGGAALALALQAAARSLAQTSAGLRGLGGELVQQAVSSAAARAALALTLAEAVTEGGDAAAQAALIRAAAEALGVPLAGALTLLRGAALALPTDDGAARIAAAEQVSALVQRLG
jgi:hypothetical protein